MCILIRNESKIISNLDIILSGLIDMSNTLNLEYFKSLKAEFQVKPKYIMWKFLHSNIFFKDKSLY